MKTGGYWRSLSTLGRDARLVVVIMFIVQFTYLGVSGTLLNLYLLRLGYDLTFVGGLASIMPLSLGVLALPAGVLGARWGYRRTMMWGVGLAALTQALVPACELMADNPARSIWIVTMSVLSGVGFACLLVCSVPYTTGVTRPENRSHAFALRYGLSTVGGFLGSLAAGASVDVLSRWMGTGSDHPAPFRWTLVVGMLILLIPVLIMRTMGRTTTAQEATSPEESPASSRFIWGVVLVLGVVTLLRSGGETSFRIFYNVYLDQALQAPPGLIGFSRGLGQLAGLPAALAVPVLVARLRRRGTVLTLLVFQTICFLPLALLGHWLPATCGYVGVEGTANALRSSMNQLGQEIVPADRRGVMSGTMFMAMGISYAAMALGGAQIIKEMGFAAMFLAGAGTVLAAAAVFAVYFWGVRSDDRTATA